MDDELDKLMLQYEEQAKADCEAIQPTNKPTKDCVLEKSLNQRIDKDNKCSFDDFEIQWMQRVSAPDEIGI